MGRRVNKVFDARGGSDHDLVLVSNIGMRSCELIGHYLYHDLAFRSAILSSRGKLLTHLQHFPLSVHFRNAGNVMCPKSIFSRGVISSDPLEELAAVVCASIESELCSFRFHGMMSRKMEIMRSVEVVKGYYLKNTTRHIDNAVSLTVPLVQVGNVPRSKRIETSRDAENFDMAVDRFEHCLYPRLTWTACYDPNDYSMHVEENFGNIEYKYALFRNYFIAKR
ncbi:hypothetical protein Tcan_18552 [Toxocara canis]|uniref:Uncharacterized protein n=1 Tax=Toxocara canis TaxID=6265 RepID=A0A0B2VK38_TOXCA|nr:hypothetical protein Tcan_18552 [Toxocara canis]